MKLAFISYTLSTGGFTASLLPLLQKLKSSNIDIELYLFEKTSAPQIDIDDIPIHYIQQNKEKMPLFVRLRFIATMKGATKCLLENYLKGRILQEKESMKRYKFAWAQVCQRIEIERTTNDLDLTDFDCVISWEETYPNYYLAERVTAKQKIGYVHSDYTHACFCAATDRAPYNKLDRIAFVSQSTKETFCLAQPTLVSKAIFIPNIINVDRVKYLMNSEPIPFEKSVFDIVTVCRLDNTSKALYRAVEIANALKQEGKQFRWYIVGEGLSRNKLECMISNYHLEDTVILTGEKTNPYLYMRHADLFVLQSHYEGKPLVVDEALIVGTPVLVTNYTSAAEQVIDGYTGFIVENSITGICLKLSSLIENKATLKDIRSNLQKLDTSVYSEIRPFINAITEK